MMSLLQKEYIVLALITFKNAYFNENFVTLRELNMFVSFMQQYFINQKIDIVVTSNNLSREDFSIIDNVIKLSDNCAYSLERLPKDIFSILTDLNLIAEFFMILEKEKLEKLENRHQEISKVYEKNKITKMI